MISSLRRLAPLLLLLCTSGRPAIAADLEPLDFQTAAGARHFEVEVARSDADRQRGLMYRRNLPPDHGMLFQFDKEERIYMWMKNTYLPLDMIFVGKDGRVVSIARGAEPLSERIISSQEPATAVVEVVAGVAERNGIAKGDQMVFPVAK